MKVRRYHRPRRTIVLLDGLAVLWEMVERGQPIMRRPNNISAKRKRLC